VTVSTALRDLLASFTLVTIAAASALLLSCSPAQAQAVPQAAKAWRADLVRNARAVWGLDAPVSTFAAQVHQESGWRPGAVSHVGARGLAQFMPATADWISRLYPDLRVNDPLSPGWALRALVQYDAWLHARVQAVSPCERFAFVLSAYNGGLGWVQRDKALALREGLDAARWFDQVERVNAGRSQANWRENRDYPRRILRRIEPTYVAAGWGSGVCA
jgi:membrane-bound lytic murein transglycosylase MltF